MKRLLLACLLAGMGFVVLLFEQTIPALGYMALLLILLPILVYYLYGPTEFCERLAQVSLAFPIGLATFPLLSKTQLLDPLTVNYLTFAAMFLLMISFFIIFSAWKHRFILLKY